MPINLSQLREFPLHRGNYSRGIALKKEVGPAKLVSQAYESEKSLRRECILHVPGKFTAQTMVIFPFYGVNTPVFGCEYIEIPSKSFGAVDFHPQAGDLTLIKPYLGPDLPPNRLKSKHYDLEKYFSPWLWLRKGEKSVYSEFYSVCNTTFSLYSDMLEKVSPLKTLPPTDYCNYMATHDPARGILKAYFGSEFADDYIEHFLFPKNPNFSDFVQYLL
jgi:phycoerythrobilin:ferredoxin oxidoreductase